MPSSDPKLLVSTAWLADHLEAPDLRVLDASWHMPDAGRDARAEYALERYLRLEDRAERSEYRSEAERLLYEHKLAANPELAPAMRVLRFLAPVRRWVLALWPKRIAEDGLAP